MIRKIRKIRNKVMTREFWTELRGYAVIIGMLVAAFVVLWAAALWERTGDHKEATRYHKGYHKENKL